MILSWQAHSTRPHPATTGWCREIPYHRELAAAAHALAECVASSQEPILLLDLGCGSGASTRAIVDAFGQRIERVKIIGIDASAGMLKQARDKPGPAAYGSNVPLRNSCR